MVQHADPTRPALETLRNEFLRASTIYPPLHHQQLLDFYEENAETSDAWRDFASANTSKEWQEWHGPVFSQDFTWFGRFYGNAAGLPEFKQLADGLYSVIRQLDPKWDAAEEEEWDGSLGTRPGGFEQCLDLLHRIAANWPTPLIRSEESRWGLGEEHERKKRAIGTAHAENEELTEEELKTLHELDAVEESVAAGENGVVYLVHPWVETIPTNLFSAFASLIEIILDQKKAFFTSVMHWSEPDIPTLDEIEDSSNEPKQVTADSPKKSSAYLFRLDGETWRVRYPDDNDGKERLVPDAFGLHHYHKLLLEPGRRQTIADFIPGFVDEDAGAGTGLTRKEIRETKQQIKRWRTQADAAEEEGAFASAAELRKQADDTERWLREKEEGALGKPRPVKTPKQKEALDKIRVYMARARNSLHKRGMHNLADHLDRTCKPTWGGTEWRYQPTASLDWDL